MCLFCRAFILCQGINRYFEVEKSIPVVHQKKRILEVGFSVLTAYEQYMSKDLCESEGNVCFSNIPQY